MILIKYFFCIFLKIYELKILIQVIVLDLNTMFIDHIIFVMKNVLENKTDQPAEHLGVTSIEPLMLAIVR